MYEPPEDLTVHIVDPSWGDAEQLKRLLRRIDVYNVSINHVRSREDALKSIEHTMPDLILLEHQLSDETGLELAREIRLNYYSLPIVVVTDEDDVNTCARYFRTGVDDYRTREQLNRDELHAAIQHALTQRKSKVERKRAAKFDELTNLYNRRFSFKRIHEEMASAVRHDHSFSLCLIDLDGFKEINDRLGHLSGDHLLKRVSELIRESVRTDDIVGRYGGDEFLLGLRNTDSSGAYRAARKLTNEVGNAVFTPPAGEQVQVNCSIGVAEFIGDSYDHDDEFETVEELFDRADNALYLAKEERERDVERRTHRRHDLDEPVSVTLSDDQDEYPAHMVDVSRSGVRLKGGPPLDRGQKITLLFHLGDGQHLEKEGIIRSCRTDENSSLATLGVEVELPRDLIEKMSDTNEETSEDKES